MSELISVIVPVYNVERYLARCIESITGQTYRELEIILVNDGSTDSSGEICDKYASMDLRIKVLHKENGGVSSARNMGLGTVSGKYICWVDGDDYIEPQMIECLYDNLIHNNADVSICNYHTLDEKTGERNKEIQIKEAIWDKRTFWENYYNCNQYYCVVLWNKLFKRELFNDIVFPVGRISEDAWVMGTVIDSCNRIYASDRDCYSYLKRENSSMVTSLITCWLSAVEACIDRMKIFECANDEDDYTNIIEKNMSYIMRIMVNTRLNCGDKKKEIIKQYTDLKKRCKLTYNNYKKYFGSRIKLQYLIFIMNESLYGFLMKLGKNDL